MTERAAAPLAAGEFGFDRTDFAFIANTLYEDAGISLPASKANLVYSRLAKRLRALGLEKFRDYCALVGSEDGRDERAQMVAALTTNVMLTPTKVAAYQPWSMNTPNKAGAMAKPTSMPE